MTQPPGQPLPPFKIGLLTTGPRSFEGSRLLAALFGGKGGLRRLSPKFVKCWPCVAQGGSRAWPPDVRHRVAGVSDSGTVQINRRRERSAPQASPTAGDGGKWVQVHEGACRCALIIILLTINQLHIVFYEFQTLRQQLTHTLSEISLILKCRPFLLTIILIVPMEKRLTAVDKVF